MEAKLDEACELIVLAGSWNTKVFAPAWIGNDRLTKAPELRIEFALVGHEFDRRFLFDNLALAVSERRLSVTPAALTVDNLRRAEEVARKILEELPHTPLTGVGVNLRIVLTEPVDKILELFELQDRNHLSDNGYVVEFSKILRRLGKDGMSFNLSQSLDSSGSVILEFNYQLVTRAGIDAAAFLDGRINSALESTNEFLRQYEIDFSITPL